APASAFTTIADQLRLAIVHVEPLDRAAVHQLAEEVLGGTLNGLGAEALNRTSGGLAGAVLEFVTEAAPTRAMVFQPAPWHLQGSVTPSASLRRDVAQRLVDLSPEAADFLDVLAVAEALPIGVVEDHADPSIVASLEGHGLLTTSGSGVAMTVSIASPVVRAV